MRRQSAKDKELEDNVRLLHREHLEEALAGVHGAVMARLMGELEHLHEARRLVDFISAQNWEAVDADTRLIALHEINTAITKLRERHGLAPIDDALPGERLAAFQLIRTIVNSAGNTGRRPAESSSRPSDEARGEYHE